MVVVLDCVLDLLEGILGVVHAEGDPVQQVRLEEGHGGVVEAEREATVVVADAGGLLQAAGRAEVSDKITLRCSTAIFLQKRF